MSSISVSTSKKGKNTWFSVAISESSYDELLVFLHFHYMETGLAPGMVEIYDSLLQGLYESSGFQEEHSEEYDEYLQTGDYKHNFFKCKAIEALDQMLK